MSNFNVPPPKLPTPQSSLSVKVMKSETGPSKVRASFILATVIVAVLIVSSLFLTGILSFSIPFVSTSQGPTPSQGTAKLVSNSFSGSGLNVSSINYSSDTVEFVIRNTGNNTININYGTVARSNSLSSNILCNHRSITPDNSAICRISNVSAINGTNFGVYLSYSLNGSDSNLYASGNVTARKTNVLGMISHTGNYTNSSNVTYLTTFVESGLPQGATWDVIYDGIYSSSSYDKIGFYTLQGNFSFTASDINTSSCIFYASPASGVAVAGSSQLISFSHSCTITTFVSPSPSTFPGYKYSGIWWIDYGPDNSSATLGNNLIFSFNSSFSNSSLQYNGGAVFYNNNIILYCSFAISSANTGSVINTSSQSSWNCDTYFMEAGLPPGNIWVISLAGTNMSSNSSKIKFSEHPNVYSFVSYPVSVNKSLYIPANTSGTVRAGSLNYVYYSKNVSRPQITSFTESGLPSGVTWSVQIIGTPKCALGTGPHCEIAGLSITNSSADANITFSATNSTIYHYTFYIPNVVYANSTYVSSPSAGNLSLGSAYSVHFSVLKTITTNIKENGLPLGTLWNASLLYPVCAIQWIGTYHCMIALHIMTNSSNTNVVTFTTQNATEYGFIVYNVSIGSETYVPSPSRGLINSSSSVNVVFTAHNVTNYTTTKIIESGIPSGVLWNASLLSPVCAISWIGKYHCMIVITTITNESKTDTISFNTPVGSSYGFIVYNVSNGNFTYAPSPLHGLINASSTVYVSFIRNNVTKLVNTTFSDTGLSVGLVWSVKYNGITKSAGAPSDVVFSTYPGTYAYSVTPPSNSSQGCITTYYPSPASGSTATGTYTVINFNKSMSCTAAFTESGLPSNTSWSVTYGGSTVSSSLSKIVFSSIVSSIYNFSVSSPIVSNCTYSPSPASGTLSTGGSQSIIFTGSCVSTFVQIGLPSTRTWSVTYNGTTENAGMRCFGKCYYSSSISFTVIAGWNYAYSIPILTNASNNCTSTYTPRPSSGYSFAGSSKNINFSASTRCTTSFIESGMPAYANWRVTFDSLNGSSNSTAMHFATNSGEYNFEVPKVCYPAFNGTYYVPSIYNGTLKAGAVKYFNFTQGAHC